MGFFDNHVMNTRPRYSTNIYVASSWRNERYPEVVRALKSLGYSRTYDFRNPAPGNKGFSWKEVDPEYELGKKVGVEAYRLMLKQPAAERSWAFDMVALNACHICILVLPAGRSASWEFGYACSSGKHCAVLWPEAGDEPDLMYRGCTILSGIKELTDWCDSKDC